VDARGVALVLAAAILTSTKAIFVKLAYPYGVDALTLLALRMAMSLPVFAVMAVVEEARARDRATPARDYAIVAALGIAGHYLASYLDFAGLAYVTAGLERLVLFTYPTFAVLISAAFFRHSVTRREIVALALTYVGVACAFGGERLGAGPNTLKGAALVAGGAIAYAVYLVGSGKVMARFGANRLVAQAACVSCIAILAHFAVAHPLSALRVPTPVYGYAAGIAVLTTVIPMLLLGQGIRRIGASRAAILTSVGPVATIVLARVFLDEAFGALQAIGTAFVLLGVAQLGAKKSEA
jgi:drug/metabolite transporter (DMT)-like permease